MFNFDIGYISSMSKSDALFISLLNAHKFYFFLCCLVGLLSLFIWKLKYFFTRLPVLVGRLKSGK